MQLQNLSLNLIAMKIAVVAVAILGALSLAEGLQPVDVKVTFDESFYGFNVSLSGVEWLRSGPIGIRDAGQWWASNNKDKYLVKVEQHLEGKGIDMFGVFDSTEITWQAYSDPNTPAKVQFKTYVKAYADEPMALFSIEYTDGLTNASIPDTEDQTLSSFPSFLMEETDVKRASLTWARGMTDTIEIAEWTPDKGVYGKVDGGFPLVVFNSAMDTALVLSPATTFMSANQYNYQDNQTKERIITFGPMSSIDEIPAGYTYSTILVAGNNVTGTMRRFGEILRRMYSKTLEIRRTDFSINYLGYWTDNGACYYYTTGSKYSNYEDLLVAVKKDADDNGIPFRYVQLDSWWYYKGPHDGVKNWTARPDIFPNGIEALVNKTGWRVVGHNRWWSHDTDYQYKFKFIVEEDVALPVDSAFWDYLMASSQIQWSLIVYEQDWLCVQSPKTKALHTTLDLGEVWLKQMGESAQRYGISVEYCMAWPRHVMQSVAIPAVTHTRASGDYQPSNSQWNIGDSSILTHSIGLAPFKDNFRTSASQPDCRKFHNMTEGYPALETYVAVLSTGPVGPSDQIGTANKTLIMATCAMDGRILKPTHPAMSIDSTLIQRAFGSGGPQGEFAAAFTEIGGYTWYYILAAELSSPYSMSASELPPSHSTFPMSSFPKSIAFQYTLDKTVTKTADFGSDTKLDVSQCGKSDFQYWVIAPYLSNGYALLGELDKVTSVSEARFSDIVTSGDAVTMKVSGVPTEEVSVTLYDMSSKKTVVIACTISDSGINQLTVADGGSTLSCKGI